MLKIQEFLRSGGTLQDINQKLEIDYNVDADLGVVVFNYRTFAPLSNPIVQESRGLVLELDTWNVVCKSLNAFFEPKMLECKPVLRNFDWNTAKAQEKLDGALICLYYYKDKWHVSMRFSADGKWIVWSINAKPNKITWTEYVKITLQDMGTTWEEFTSKLDKNIFYTFEIVGPENRVVVVYPERKLYLVAAINKHTLQEINIYDMEFPELKPSYVNVNNLDEAWKLVLSEIEPYSHEGRIIVDSKFNRLKLRNPAYVEVMQSYSTEDQHKALKQIKQNVAMATTTCHPLNQVIDTPNGPIEIGQLKVGDKVLGRMNTIQTIKSINDYKETPVLLVTHESGVLKCTDSHPIFINSNHVVTAGNLTFGSSIVDFKGQKTRVISTVLDKKQRVRSIEVVPDHEYTCNGILNHNMPLDQTNSKNTSGLSIFSEFASMARYIQNSYQKNKATEHDPDVVKIWPKAFEKLSEGMAMSEILDTSSNDEILEALKRFNEENKKAKEKVKDIKSRKGKDND